jgi:SAM-dependent methyltransferase
MTEAETHRAVTRREFARQAPNFERPGSLFRDRDILGWIGAQVPVAPTDRVLDVAGGTGQLGRFLGRDAALTVIVDLTSAMLEAGASAARAGGDERVVLVLGDATALPFAGDQFDVVVSRFAFHHLDDVAAAAREMARVCRPGGTVAIVDMASEPGEPGRVHNELERLRDPSHTRGLREEEMVEVLAAAGVDAAVVSDHRHPMPVVPWLRQAEPAEDASTAVLAALAAEADRGAPATGLRARREDGELVVEQRWVIAAGQRRANAA